MKIKLMRKIDWYVGVPLCYFLSVLNGIKKTLFNKKLNKVRKILVIKFFGIGSIVLTSPALIALRDRFPEAEIDFLTFKQNEEILNLLNLTYKNYFIDSKNIFKFVFSVFKIIYQLRKEKYDIVFDLEFFAKFPLIMAFLTGARRKAGFYLVIEPWRKSLLDYYGYYNHYYHTKDIFLSLVYLVKENDPYYLNFDEYIQAYEFPRFVLSENDKKGITQRLKNLGWQGEKIILINPNAGLELAPTLKKWPKDHFALFIEKFTHEYPKVFIILTGSKSEKSYVQEIIDIMVKSNKKITNLAGETSLKELLCLFELSSLFVSVDSGPMHLATLTNIPIIGLFGAGIPVVDGPKSKNSVALYKNLYCVPMLTVYNGKQTELKENIPVKLITVDEVFNKAKEIMI
ncbi:MAG: glycosyltransferase family 9 protein [Patescibacteria group bacterium]|nr:glycosyltransferase family 9 protein [Patescibacteria group bacterium]